jgi:terminase large subunit-like protein
MILAGDMRMALDPALIGERVGLTLDPWQATVLRGRPKRSLMCCARQTGKTTVANLLSLWTAVYEPPSLVLIVSPSQRQSSEVFRSFMLLYSKLEGAPALVQESALRAQLANGSRIVALPGSERTLRGYSAAKLIVIDEAAAVPDELITATRPMLGTVDGSLVALSTPRGARGWFHSAWVGDAGQWSRTMVRAVECPRLSAEFLTEELRSLGPTAFRQEYECEFSIDAESIFSAAMIARAFSHDLRAVW